MTGRAVSRLLQIEEGELTRNDPARNQEVKDSRFMYFEHMISPQSPILETPRQRDLAQRDILKNFKFLNPQPPQ